MPPRKPGHDASAEGQTTRITSPRGLPRGEVGAVCRAG
jgi:hypothetical protein